MRALLRVLRIQVRIVFEHFVPVKGILKVPSALDLVQDIVQRRAVLAVVALRFLLLNGLQVLLRLLCLLARLVSALVFLLLLLRVFAYAAQSRWLRLLFLLTFLFQIVHCHAVRPPSVRCRPYFIPFGSVFLRFAAFPGAQKPSLFVLVLS